MEHFLSLVARHIIKSAHDQNVDLSEYCIVFPNRRSGTFFRKELIRHLPHTTILPQVTTILDFISDVSNLKEIDRIEALFLLYNTYRQLSTADDLSFDKFVTWGDTVLNDFNDIDRSLLRAEPILKNAKELREMRSDYLTDEQYAVLEKYFDIPKRTPGQHDDVFWTHTRRGKLNTEKYNALWEVIHVLYEKFNERLAQEGVAYQGAIYKKATEIIQNTDIDDLPFKRYVFAGFNVLSASEITMLNSLKKRGIASFYWDFNSPAFNKTNGNTRAKIACKFMDKNIEIFPMPDDFYQEPITTFPEIFVEGVPSEIGQAKLAIDIAKDIYIKKKDSKSHDIYDDVDTAIILPDESMLMPIVQSLNNTLKTNITVGYPLHRSAICSLMRTIARLHAQSRKQKEKFLFFHEDIKDLAADLLINEILPEDQRNALRKFVGENHNFMISAEDICSAAPMLTPIFFSPKLNDFNDFSTFIGGIINILTERFAATANGSLGHTLVIMYARLLTRLRSIVDKYQIPLESNTSFYILDRLASGQTVAFEGEPLHGLQVMGVLESRCLDFKNLIILSVNERIYPRKRRSRSFIPKQLRKYHGLSTTDDQESMHSYYFFRMLSRASTVHLIYDSRTEGISSGEYSRFVYQLKYLFNAIPEGNFNLINSAPCVAQEIKFSVPKTERILQRLNRYISDGDDKKYLSASSINQYINCPLSFYLKYIEKMPSEEEANEFMDSMVIGTIAHESLNEIYRGKKLNKEDLQRIKNNKDYIKQVITKHSNINFLRKKDERRWYEPLTGEPMLVSQFLEHFINEVLTYDINLVGDSAQIDMLTSEEKKYTQLEINGKKVNINYIIDRLDIFRPANNQSPRLRIIDYKTGKDVVAFNSVDALFDKKKQISARPHAIMQLLLYANCLLKDESELCDNVDIQPMIYKLRNINSSGIKYDKDYISDFRKNDLNKKFLEKFGELIDEIFDPNTPFFSTPCANNCALCDYKEFCRKDESDFFFNN